MTLEKKCGECSCPAYQQEESCVACVRAEVRLDLWPVMLFLVTMVWTVGTCLELTQSAVMMFCVVAILPILIGVRMLSICQNCGKEVVFDEHEPF